jgi:hypothetical protein
MFKNTKNEAFWQVFFGIFEWVVQQAQHLHASRVFVLQKTETLYIWWVVLRIMCSGKIPCQRVAAKR